MVVSARFACIEGDQVRRFQPIPGLALEHNCWSSHCLPSVDPPRIIGIATSARPCRSDDALRRLRVAVNVPVNLVRDLIPVARDINWGCSIHTPRVRVLYRVAESDERSVIDPLSLLVQDVHCPRSRRVVPSWRVQDLVECRCRSKSYSRCLMASSWYASLKLASSVVLSVRGLVSVVCRTNGSESQGES